MSHAALNETLAKNLRYFMQQDSCPYKNANALGVAAGLSPQTIRNILTPVVRPTTCAKPVGYPTLDKLATIAAALGCEVWELLHPDLARSRAERALYKMAKPAIDSVTKSTNAL